MLLCHCEDMIKSNILQLLQQQQKKIIILG